MKRLMVAVSAMACFVFNGCIESEDSYTLNSDGSGKVVRMVIFQPNTGMPAGFSMGGDESPNKKKTPEEEVKEAGKAEIEQSEGVEVWKDAKAYRAKDGRICFTGIAYFKDFAKLKLHNGGFAMQDKPTWTKDAAGKFVLEFKKEEKDTENSFHPVKPAPKATMTAEEVKEGIADARREYKDMMDMMGKGLSSMKMYMSFCLPGKVEASRNFKTDKAGNPCVFFQGAKMIAVMDEMVKDDKWMEQQVRAGVSFGMGEGPDIDDIMNEKLFGQKGSIRATVAAESAPLFDYAAEVAAAQAAYPAVLKQFGAAGAGGMTKEAKTAPTLGAAMTDLKVDSMSLLEAENQVPVIRAMGKLPCQGMSADEGKVEKVVTDNGENLLPEKEFYQKIPFPHLDDDKITVEMMDMQIKLPSAAAKSIKELSGYLVYSVAKGTKMVDLGITELVAGATGTEYRATITKVEEDKWTPGTQKIELDLAVAYEAIKSVQVLDAAGKALEAENSGGGGFFGKSSIKISVKGAVPKAGRIKIELYDNIQKFKAPFTLKDIVLPKLPPAAPKKVAASPEATEAKPATKEPRKEIAAAEIRKNVDALLAKPKKNHVLSIARQETYGMVEMTRTFVDGKETWQLYVAYKFGEAPEKKLNSVGITVPAGWKMVDSKPEGFILYDVTGSNAATIAVFMDSIFTKLFKARPDDIMLEAMGDE